MNSWVPIISCEKKSLFFFLSGQEEFDRDVFVLLKVSGPCNKSHLPTVSLY